MINFFLLGYPSSCVKIAKDFAEILNPKVDNVRKKKFLQNDSRISLCILITFSKWRLQHKEGYNLKCQQNERNAYQQYP